MPVSERKQPQAPTAYGSAVSFLRWQGGSRVITVTRVLPRQWEVVDIDAKLVDDDTMILRVKRIR